MVPKHDRIHNSNTNYVVYHKYYIQQQYSFYVPYVLPLGAIFFSGIITETVCSNNPKFYYHLYSGLCFLISSKYVYI